MCKLRVIVFLLTTLFITGMTTTALAGTLNNQGFSSFGLGGESLNYGEFTLLSGAALKQNALNNNLSLRTESYTPAGDNTGFYITATTTLDSRASQEKWNLNSFGTVQSNLREMRISDVSVDGVYHLTPGIHVLLGVGLSSTAFTRSNFQAGAGLNAFNNYLTAKGQGSLSLNTGAVSEQIFNVLLRTGLRYDNFFSTDEHKIRFIAGVNAAVPMYYSVENTSLPGYNWVNAFKGVDLSAELGVGMSIYKNFSWLGMIEAIYRERAQTAKLATSATSSAWVPKTIITGIRYTVNINWTF